MNILKSETADNLYFWIEHKNEGNFYPQYASHRAYELYIILSGERYMYLNNVLYHVTAGDAVMISPDIPHRSFGSSAFSGICIEFSDTYLKQHFTPAQCCLVYSCFRKNIISMDKPALEKTYDYAKEAKENPLASDMCLVETITILHQFLPHSNPDSKLSFESDMSPIGQYIQQNYLHINGLNELCRHFSLSKSYLCRLFKQHTGITITHYINALRIQRACQMLAETSLSINEILHMCGYTSNQYFNRVFKKMIETTPLAYRNQSRATNMWNYDDSNEKK